MVSTRLFTAEELLQMKNGESYELIDGELMEVSPTSFESSRVTAELTGFIVPFVRAHKLGFVISAEGGVVLRRNPDTVVAPDIGFIRKERLPIGHDPGQFLQVPPDLAVEVVSPSNTGPQLLRKLEIYQSVGVPMVWIVEPRHQTVTVHETGQIAKILRSGEMLSGGSILPGLLIPIEEIFANPFDN